MRRSAPNLSVTGASPFRILPKSLPTPVKERSLLWPTLNPPVAKQIPPVAKTFSPYGQPCVLASILGYVDAKTDMNWRENKVVMTPTLYFGHGRDSVWPRSEVGLAMDRKEFVPKMSKLQPLPACHRQRNGLYCFPSGGGPAGWFA